MSPGIIVQIILLDLIFSFDSILTAVGLTEHVIIMIIAVVLSIGIMIIFSGAISNFIHKHPSMEVLALRLSYPDWIHALFGRTTQGST